jgi:hypothetical protein
LRVCDVKDCKEPIKATLMDKRTFEEFDLCENHRLNFTNFINPKDKLPKERIKPNVRKSKPRKR